ncbi:MAG: shikimate dehydrogenase [Candidatus Limnocylindria bacterium]
MAVAYLLGHPVAHSLSPAMHNAAFAALGMPHRYEVIDVAPAALVSAVDALRDPSVLGANVTIPHKAAVMMLVDLWDGVALRTGAVNTISRHPADGRVGLQGWNTDQIGFKRALHVNGIDVRSRRALVLGAGGAAQAIVPGLLALGATVMIANRTRERAERLAALFPESGRPVVHSWPDEGALEAADVVVNTTSLGLHGEDPLAGATLAPGLVVVDIVPTAGESALVRRALAAGCTVVDGLAMLLYQAVESFRIWTGAHGLAVEDAMRAALPRPV